MTIYTQTFFHFGSEDWGGVEFADVNCKEFCCIHPLMIETLFGGS